LKKINKIFVTTAIKDTWGNDENIFFLGEWCKKYNEKHIWGDRNSITIPWHWSNRNKIKEDFDYIKGLYEKILVELAYELNCTHKVNYSLRYWRIILGPWLTTYVAVIWDRWESIESFRNLEIESETIIPYQNISTPIAEDYNAAFELMTNNDLWNYLIYCDILQAQNLDAIRLIKKNIFLDKEDKNSKKQSSWLVAAAIKLDKFLYKIYKVNSYDFVFYKSYFQYKFLLKLFYKVRQIPRIYSEFEKEIDYKGCHSFIRPKLDADSDLTHFERFLYGRIFKDMPNAYLEGYENLSSYCMSLPDAKVIFTANAHFHNEKFKVWSAQQISKGSKLIISEHGGSIISELADLGSHEDKICNKKAVWHTALNAKHIKLSPNKLIKKHLDYTNSRVQVIMVGLEFPRYSYRCQSGPNSSLILDDFNQKVNFIDLLDVKTRAVFKVRPYPNRGWFTKDRYSDIYGKGIISKNTTLDKNYKMSKLIICTYPQTTFSEAMHSGVPTILLYIEKYWELHPAFDELMVKLKEVGIVYSDPIKAAKHVNNISHNPKIWWNKKETIRARNMFFDICGAVSDNPLDDWSCFFNKVKDGSAF
jgi:putative transferase (TIGR04331 family)